MNNKIRYLLRKSGNTTRNLIMLLAYRDIKAKYAQTSIGVLWSIVKPIALLVIFAYVFSYLFKMDTGDQPYYLIVLPAILIWSYFSQSLGQAGNSLVASQQMIHKSYFPRQVLPLAKVAGETLEFLLGFGLLTLYLLFYCPEMVLHRLLLLPLTIMFVIFSTTSFSLLLSILIVRFRDIQHGVQYVIQALFFLTPVAYPSDFIPEKLQGIMLLNPIALSIELVRYIFLNGPTPPPIAYFGILIPFVIWGISLRFFQKNNSDIAELL